MRLGHYRGWLLGLQGLMVAGVALLMPLNLATDLHLVFALVIVIAFLSATQDVATDATAVRLLSPSERGAGNGIQLASGNLGFILGRDGVLVVYDRVGWLAAVGVLALVTAARCRSWPDTASRPCRRGLRGLPVLTHPGVPPSVR